MIHRCNSPPPIHKGRTFQWFGEAIGPLAVGCHKYGSHPSVLVLIPREVDGVIEMFIYDINDV